MKSMICTDHLAYSCANYELFDSVNNIVENSITEVSIVPLDISSKVMPINTAIHTVVEMGSFKNGLLICSSIKNADIILGCANNSRKILYLYDLEWMFELHMYDDLYNTLTNQNLEIVVRSEDFIRPLECLCKPKILGVLPTFDLEKLWNLLK